MFFILHLQNQHLKYCAYDKFKTSQNHTPLRRSMNYTG